MTALQLYYGPQLWYADLPHAPVKQNLAITVNSRSGMYLNMSLTVSNSGSEVEQVYVKLYSKVVAANMIDDANICIAVGAALDSTIPPVKHWDNVGIAINSTWSSGNFFYRLVGVDEAYVLVATLTCLPLGELPSCTPTEDPCVAVYARLFAGS